MTCVRCRCQEATTKRRTVSYFGTWNMPEPVCGWCARELDTEAERLDRVTLQVDHALREYRRKVSE